MQNENNQMNVNSQIAVEQKSSLVQGQDGKYRWLFEFHLFAHTHIFQWFMKVTAAILCLSFVLSFFLRLAAKESLALAAKASAFLLLYELIAILLIALVIYALYFFTRGTRQYLIFELDAKGLNRMRLPKKFNSAELEDIFKTLEGGLSSNIAQTASILTASDHVKYTDFSKVKSVRPNSKLKVIRLHQGFALDTVYVGDADFNFVLHYLIDHCTHLR